MYWSTRILRPSFLRLKPSLTRHCSQINHSLSAKTFYEHKTFLNEVLTEFSCDVSQEKKALTKLNFSSNKALCVKILGIPSEARIGFLKKSLNKILDEENKNFNLSITQLMKDLIYTKEINHEIIKSNIINDFKKALQDPKILKKLIETTETSHFYILFKILRAVDPNFKNEIYFNYLDSLYDDENGKKILNKEKFKELLLNKDKLYFLHYFYNKLTYKPKFKLFSLFKDNIYFILNEAPNTQSYRSAIYKIILKIRKYEKNLYLTNNEVNELHTIMLNNCLIYKNLSNLSLTQNKLEDFLNDPSMLSWVNKQNLLFEKLNLETSEAQVNNLFNLILNEILDTLNRCNRKRIYGEVEAKLAKYFNQVFLILRKNDIEATPYFINKFSFIVNQHIHLLTGNRRIRKCIESIIFKETKYQEMLHLEIFKSILDSFEGESKNTLFWLVKEIFKCQRNLEKVNENFYVALFNHRNGILFLQQLGKFESTNWNMFSTDTFNLIHNYAVVHEAISKKPRIQSQLYRSKFGKNFIDKLNEAVLIESFESK